MEFSKDHLVFTIFSLYIVSTHIIASKTTLQTYLVQLHPHGMPSSVYNSKFHWHLSFLHKTVSLDQNPSSRLLYSYGTAMEGFSAQLSESELELLRKLPNVIAIRPDRKFHVQTTYSYKFLGLNPTKGAWQESGFGRGTIIGILDTGIWPESPSFDDQNMPPVPKKWKGICQEGQGFNTSNCNKKVIGARFFVKGHHVASPIAVPNAVVEYVSPRDSHGHGTHTTSTAAGVSVPNASVFGNGAGIASGMAPGSHIAVYKVCWFTGCYSSDILAAMDVAIKDGVDVLSLSLGGFPLPLYDDIIAIGSFRAAEHGVSVVCAAGNNGPIKYSVASIAPWITSVGASTLDRRFPATVQIGSGKKIYGESVYPGRRSLAAGKDLEVIYLSGGDKGSEFCFRGSLPRKKVRGKIVVCDRGVNGRAEKGEVVKEAGGVAMILANTEINLEEDSVDAHVLPAITIGYAEALHLKSYINLTSKPTARIAFSGTVMGRISALEVARFSARGPNLYDPTILKPDVVAPGVNIIAAWPQNLGPSSLPEDPRRVNFTILSGTSMSCPHVSGIASLIHAAYPKWSPAAVRSAIMTTAEGTNHQGKPIMDGENPAALFAIGSGHVNPERAINPGLIYDIKPEDYITHLCTLGYGTMEIFTITHRNVSCHKILEKSKGFSLNYPSVSVVFKGKMRRQMIRRQVTNVGESNSIYSVEVSAPEGVRVRVRPRRLMFKHTNQVLGYKIWIISRKRTKTQKLDFSDGHLTWVYSGKSTYRVRSPISVTWKPK